MKSKHSLFSSISFKQFSLLVYLVAFSCLLIGSATAQTTGDFKSKASGNWGDFTTWQVYNGATWVDAIAGEIPGGTNEADAINVYLEAGFTVKLEAMHSCKNLNLNTTADVVRINTQDNILEVWGKMRFYSGTAPGANDGTNSGINDWISTGGTQGTNPGKIRFRGTTDRTIVAAFEANANASNRGWSAEFAFDNGKTATIGQQFRVGYGTIVSGIVKVAPTVSLRMAGDGATSIAGTLTVRTGATLIGGQFFKGNTDPFLTFTLESGAFLYFENTATPILAAQNIILDGTVGLTGTTSIFPNNGGTRPASAVTNTFNNLIVAGTGAKALQNNITVNNTLTLAETGSINLNTRTLQYASNGSLEYKGSAAQTTNNAEFPVVNGPSHLIINNGSGVNLHAARTIEGTLTLTNGLFRLGNFDFVLNQNSPAIAGIPSVTNMVVTNGTGSLKKVFNAAGTYFFPVGDVTGTTEYSYAQLTLNSADVLNATTYVGVRVIDSDHPAASSASSRVSRYWSVTTNATNVNHTGTFQYLAADVVADESSIKSYLFSDETPLATGGPQNLANTVTHRLVLSGLTGPGFATGANLCIITNNTVDTPTPQNFCLSSGSLAEFNAAPALVTSGSPVYQWQQSINGGAFADIVANAQSEDYTEPASLLAGTYKYRRVVTDPLSCLGSEKNVSNEITIFVADNISGNTIGNNQTVIAGNAAALVVSTGTLAGGDGAYTYQWQSSSTQGGPYADVAANGTSASYDPGSPTSTTYLIRKVNSGACAVATSNEITLTVPVCSITNNTLATPSVTDFCASSGTLDPFEGSTSIVTSTNPVYQWQQSVNSSPFNDIATNGQNEDYTVASSLSAGTYKYRRIVSDPLSCLSTDVNTSNEITIVVAEGIAGNTIQDNQVIIIGDATASLSGNGTLTGGDGTYTYQWQSSAAQGGPYTNVTVDGTLPAYDPGSPSSTIYYVRKVDSDNCSSLSNEVSIIVSPITSTDDAADQFGIKLFPNPVTETLTITFSNRTANGTMAMKLQNSLGITVQELTIKEGLQQVQVSLENYSAGIYYVNIIQNGNSVTTYKVIKR